MKMGKFEVMEVKKNPNLLSVLLIEVGHHRMIFGVIDEGDRQHAKEIECYNRLIFPFVPSIVKEFINYLAK